MSTDKPVRICHLTTIDTNIGDDWIREGIIYLLEQASSIRFDHVCVNIHDWKSTIIDEDGRDKILSSDGIIMAGTPFYFINERNDFLRKAAKVFFSLIGLFTGFSMYDGRCSGAKHVKPLWYDRIGKVYKVKPVAILAAGTNLAFDSDISELLQDRFIRKFLKDIHAWSRVNTVREPLASSLLKKLEIEHVEFPCSAFWAMDRFGIKALRDPQLVVFNYMAGGGHYRFEGGACHRWESTLMDVFNRAVKYYGQGRVRVICHCRSEADMATNLMGGRFVLFDPSYVASLEHYSHARTGIVNRCHGLIAMAGFASPSIVVGKDSRTLMADEIKLPRYFYKTVTSDELFSQLKSMNDDFEAYRRKLQEQKEAFEKSYIRLIREKYINLFDRSLA